MAGTDLRWWTGERVAERMFDALAEIENNQSGRFDQYMRSLRSYSDQDYRSYTGTSAPRNRSGALGALADSRRTKISMPVTRNIVDAATSMLCRARPVPQFVPDGGDYRSEEWARNKQQFCQAVMRTERVQTKKHRMVKNGAIFGPGYLKVVRDYQAKKIRVEPVFSPEVLVDELDGAYGDPGNIYHHRTIDRYELAELYPDKKEKIMSATPWTSHGRSTSAGARIRLVEGWHLPCYEGAKGYSALCIEGTVLDAGEYNHMASPLVPWTWNEGPCGYHGTGIPQEIFGIQYEINVILHTIQTNMWTGGNLKVLLEKGSEVPKAHINNDLRGIILEYTGKKPEWLTNDVVSNQLIQHLQWLVGQAYQVTGVSQMNAQSMTPSASMSGRARIIDKNSESQRFLEAARRLDDAIGIHIPQRILEAAEDMLSECGDMEVIHTSDDAVQKIKLSDVVGDDYGTYDIETLSTSGLANDASARFAQVEEYKAAGYYTPLQARRLHDMPNVRAADSRNRVPLEAVEQRIDLILKEGRSVTPVPELPLEYALKRANEEILRVELLEGLDPARLDMLRDWRDQVQDLMKPPTPAGAAAPPNTPPIPGGPGMGAPSPPVPGSAPIQPQGIAA